MFNIFLYNWIYKLKFCFFDILIEFFLEYKIFLGCSRVEFYFFGGRLVNY